MTWLLTLSATALALGAHPNPRAALDSFQPHHDVSEERRLTQELNSFPWYQTRAALTEFFNEDLANDLKARAAKAAAGVTTLSPGPLIQFAYHDLPKLRIAARIFVAAEERAFGDGVVIIHAEAHPHAQVKEAAIERIKARLREGHDLGVYQSLSVERKRKLVGHLLSEARWGERDPYLLNLGDPSEIYLLIESKGPKSLSWAGQELAAETQAHVLERQRDWPALWTFFEDGGDRRAAAVNAFERAAIGPAATSAFAFLRARSVVEKERLVKATLDQMDVFNKTDPAFLMRLAPEGEVIELLKRVRLFGLAAESARLGLIARLEAGEALFVPAAPPKEDASSADAPAACPGWLTRLARIFK